MVSRQTSGGFTIIEVTLFFAVTGLLFVGILAGIGGAIDRERYDDAVIATTDWLQGQYELVGNVRNNGDGNFPSCTTGTTGARGTSDCTIVGRLITTDSGTALASVPVIATADTTSPAAIARMDGKSEQDVLNAADLKLGNSDQETFTIPWSTSAGLKTSNTGLDKRFSILIIRSPKTNIINTYIVNDVKTEPYDVAADTTSTNERLLCVERDGLISSNRRGLKIVKNATNTNSVQPTTDSGGCE